MDALDRLHVSYGLFVLVFQALNTVQSLGFSLESLVQSESSLCLISNARMSMYPAAVVWHF
jgi:hypothetical protein